MQFNEHLAHTLLLSDRIWDNTGGYFRILIDKTNGKGVKDLNKVTIEIDYSWLKTLNISEWWMLLQGEKNVLSDLISNQF